MVVAQPEVKVICIFFTLTASVPPGLRLLGPGGPHAPYWRSASAQQRKIKLGHLRIASKGQLAHIKTDSEKIHELLELWAKNLFPIGLLNVSNESLRHLVSKPHHE